MLNGDENSVDAAGELGRAGRHLGDKPLLKKGGKRPGWGSLAPGALIAYQLFATGQRQKELGIGRINSNARDAQIRSVLVQPYRAMWAGVGLKSKPLYAVKLARKRGGSYHRVRR